MSKGRRQEYRQKTERERGRGRGRGRKREREREREKEREEREERETERDPVASEREIFIILRRAHWDEDRRLLVERERVCCPSQRPPSSEVREVRASEGIALWTPTSWWGVSEDLEKLSERSNSPSGKFPRARESGQNVDVDVLMGVC